MTEPQSSPAKETFSTIASHALRGGAYTVVSMITQLDMGVKGETLSPRQRRVLAVATEGALRLQQVVKDLELVMKRADDTLWTEREMMPLRTLIADAIERAQQPVAPDAPRTISVSVHSGAARCYGDRSLAERALAALIENALRFSPSDSPVHVEARRRGDRVAIGVRDAGDGVAPDDRERIFEPLYIGADAINDVGAGLGVGLGLAVARVCADALGGAVTLEATGDSGATFTLELPLPPDASQPA